LVTEAEPGWTVDEIRPYVEHLIACFGPQRLMWGSDWPVLELVSSYEQWHATARALVEDADAGLIFGGTARAFYRLDGS
jgi:L-fuconolactonase